MPGTHSTDQEQFDKSYVKNAHLQKGFNAHIIQNFVEYILRTIPSSKEQGIKILDLCCGDGGVTAALLQQLREAGIKVEKMLGYDISMDLIHIAKEYENTLPGLEFKAQDLSTMDDWEEYDVVLSLFGLHWIEDIHLAADKIYQSLKPDGKVMYFVPLEKAKLFALRQSTMNLESSTWKKSFENYTFSPFRSDPADYIQAFERGFDTENAEDISGTQDVEFPMERFKQFLASWMQELRHLQNQSEKEAYLNELMNALPKKGDLCNDAEIINGNSVRFGERIHWFFGTKRNVAIIGNEQATNKKKSASEFHQESAFAPSKK